MALVTPVRSPYLVSPALDFWMLGGASLLAYLIMTATSGFRSYYGVSNHMANLAMTMAMMSLVVNYPHFMASYRLAYSRGRDFLLRHWFQTLFVPLALVIFLAYTYQLTTEPGSQKVSENLLGIGINFMFFTVGWHYSKQAFGCVMVYAAYQGYPLSRWQRELVRLSLLSVWWYNFVHSSLNREAVFWALKYSTWRLPDWVYPLTFAIFVGLFAAVLYAVGYRNWRDGHRPHPTMVVPYLAMLIWFAPCFRQPDNFFFVVPFFHSLQYLAFVYRIERGRAASTLRATFLALGLALCGWLAFEVVPGNLDQSCNAMKTLGFSFCLIAFNLFINIHHYFLDNVLWRVRDDQEVRAALFS